MLLQDSGLDTDFVIKPAGVWNKISFVRIAPLMMASPPGAFEHFDVIIAGIATDSVLNVVKVSSVIIAKDSGDDENVTIQSDEVRGMYDI